MAIRKDQVFLIQGQVLYGDDGLQPSPEIGQRVVVATNERMAYGLLAEKEPAFRPIGHATLQDYEATAAKLRAVLKGEDLSWDLLVETGLNE